MTKRVKRGEWQDVPKFINWEDIHCPACDNLLFKLNPDVRMFGRITTVCRHCGTLIGMDGRQKGIEGRNIWIEVHK